MHRLRTPHSSRSAGRQPGGPLLAMRKRFKGSNEALGLNRITVNEPDAVRHRQGAYSRCRS